MSLKDLRGIAKSRLPRTDYDDVLEAQNEAGYVADTYLRERGWEYSSSTPGCYWLWSKEIDGKRWTGGRDLAISMQRAIDWKEPHRFVEHDEGESDECAMCGQSKEDERHA